MARLTQSYVHGVSDTPLIGQTVGAFFDVAAGRWADSDALIVRHQKVRWTYAELKRKVDDFAAGLLALGLEPGDRVGIWSPNNSEWVITQLATAKAGLILVNINPAYRLAEADYALNKVACKALVTASQFKTSDYVGMLNQLLADGRLPHLQTIIRIGGASTMCRASPSLSTIKGSPSLALSCSSTSRSTSSSPAAPPAIRRAPRSPIIIFSITASSSARR